MDENFWAKNLSIPFQALYEEMDYQLIDLCMYVCVPQVNSAKQVIHLLFMKSKNCDFFME